MAKILVIDDNTDLLQMMRLILQDRGNHEVSLSADASSPRPPGSPFSSSPPGAR
jgi:CheY-like chemotaxis protein